MRHRQSPLVEGFGLGKDFLARICGSLPQLFVCRALTVTGVVGGTELANQLAGPSGNDPLPALFGYLGIRGECTSKPFEEVIETRIQALCAEPADGGILLRNLQLLGREAGLGELETLLLFLRIASRLDGTLHAAIRPLLLDCIDTVMRLNLDILLGVEAGTSESLLDPKAPLARSGLLVARRSIGSPLEARLEIPQGLMAGLLSPLESAAEAISRLVPRAPKGSLERSDFAHIDQDVRMLQQLLGKAIEDRRVGVNVLLHGPPGVGKTELADVLARALGASLFVIPAFADGDTQDPMERLRQYRMAQGLIQSAGRSLVLLDEVEDLFPYAPWDRKDIPSKALMNDTLESNLSPALWLSNRISHMDPAYLRRFDLILEIKPPGRELRKALLCRSLPELRDNEPWLTEAVADRRISPATLVRFGRSVASMKPASAPEAAACFSHMSRQFLSALGGATETLGSGRLATGDFDLSWLNPDADLGRVASRIRSVPGARILLHGPPGTGKTRFAHHLGQLRGVMVRAKSASDLLSPYVGETEANLRQMFDEAAREGDLLLLDEADSFLSARLGGQPRWQSTQTNELLTCMERFEGVFVCTTNRLDQLDPAVMRRFDLKVGFAAPTPDQRARMVAWLFSQFRLPWDQATQATLGPRSGRLSGLVPGDIATAARKLRLVSDAPSAQDVLQALEEECAYRSGNARPIGFVY
ncbi:AAA family ATPase [Arenimonas caeni]|nr:ATP-binding protein [Arenimonas caeni]